MNWEAIGAIGEILGATAVVITLIYLTAQLKQNSLQIRLASSQTAANNYSGNIRSVLSDPQRLAVFRAGLEDMTNLPADEQAHFHALMLGFYTSHQQNVQLHEEGVITDALFQSWEDDWLSILKCPGATEWWQRFRGMVPEELRGYIDRQLEASDARPLNETVPFLKT